MTLVLDEFVQPCSSVQDNICLDLAADALHADPGPAGDAAYAAAARAVAAVDRRWLTQAHGAADGLPAPPSEACPNVENDVDLRSTPRPQHALPHVPDPTRVLSYALNNWNDNRLALALLHSAASPAQQHAVFNDLGDWRIGLVGALSALSALATGPRGLLDHPDPPRAPLPLRRLSRSSMLPFLRAARGPFLRGFQALDSALLSDCPTLLAC